MSGEIDWAPIVQSLATTNWTAVIIALVSGSAAVIGPLWLWKKQAKKESESVKAALLAEVGALVEIVERRGFITGLKNCERKLLARRSAVMGAFNTTPESFEIRIDSQFNRVFQANVMKLGVLNKNQARQIVRFHQLADSVRQDVIEGGGLARGTDSPEMFREAIDLLEEAMGIGREMVAADAKGGCSWFGSREGKK